MLGEFFFGVEFYLVAEFFDEVHGQEFFEQVWDVFYEEVGFDELGSVVAECWSGADAEDGGCFFFFDE